MNIWIFFINKQKVQREGKLSKQLKHITATTYNIKKGHIYNNIYVANNINDDDADSTIIFINWE